MSRPTAEHKILVVSINVWSKESTGAHNNLFYLYRLWRKAKCFKFIIMLMVSGGVHDPNETNCFKFHCKGRIKKNCPD